MAFACVAPRTVAVTLELRCGFLWLRTRRHEVRFRLSADGMRWFWAESGVRLEFAASYVWSSMYEAIGEHP